MTRFLFPVGILLFNRPEYAAQVLESLRLQTMTFSSESLVIVIDGYEGSKDEARGLPNRTGDVFAEARAAFPDARIHRLPHNVGIAQAFELLEREVFAQSEKSWGLFLEEDFVLYPLYLEALENLIAHVDDEPEIVMVTATGHTRSDRAHAPHELHPLGHVWAFALRRSHAEARKPLLAVYSEAIRNKPYWKRDRLQISQPFSALGIFLPGSSQDAVKKAIMHHLQKIGVTSGTAFGRYVGEHGENFGPAIFREQGFEAVPPIPQTFEFPSSWEEGQRDALRREGDKVRARQVVDHNARPFIGLRTVLARVVQRQARRIRKNVALQRPPF